MDAIILAGPAVEPVSLDEMKGYLRVDTSDEDDLVAALITSARLTVEAATRLALIEQSWRLARPNTPRRPAIRLPVAPVISIDAVAVLTPSGATTSLTTDQYRLDRSADPARLLIDDLPCEAAARDTLQIDLTCGFGTMPQAVPAPLGLAIRRLVATWFEARGDEPDDARPGGLPQDVCALLAPYIRPRFA